MVRAQDSWEVVLQSLLSRPLAASPPAVQAQEYSFGAGHLLDWEKFEVERKAIDERRRQRQAG
jgi:hypothetical protein